MMSKVYRISVNTEDFMYFVLDDYEVVTKMDDFNINSFGTSMKDMWIAPEGAFLESDSGSISVPDFSEWMSNILLFNQSSYDLLSDALSSYGEMLEVNIESKKYYLFNLINEIDDSVIDRSNCEMAVFEGSIIGVKKLSFKEELISDDVLLFTTSFNNGASIYCGDKFKDIIEKSGLTGLVFNTELAVNVLD